MSKGGDNQWWDKVKRGSLKFIGTKFTLKGVGLRVSLLGLRILLLLAGMGIATALASQATWILQIAAYLGTAVVVILLENLIQIVSIRLQSHQRLDAIRQTDKVLVELDGAIKEMREGRSILIRSLISLERTVKLVIDADEKDVTICSNFMVARYQPNRELEIIQWGTRSADRDPKVLPVDDANPLPGAPLALVEQRIVYIPDTQTATYDELFKNRPYRSILSIPVVVHMPRPHVIGVINIDSTRENYFISDEHIKEQLKAKLMPHVQLITMELEKTTVNTTQKVQNG